MLWLVVALILYLAVGAVVVYTTARSQLEGIGSLADPISDAAILLFILLVWPVFALMALLRKFDPPSHAAAQFGEAGVHAEQQGWVGQFGVAVTDLDPTGKVDVAGRWRDAQAVEGIICKGTRVEVVEADAINVKVRPA